ncbi:EthD domain-containing protein [Biscogniauxia mediterranea]|nr:EthD domain-containing protein [Biscogniauxia mediterranea]
MTYTVVAFVKRKEGITPTEFRSYYSTVHIPLMQSLVGSAFPLTHTRNFVTRNAVDGSPKASSQQEFAPVLYMGQPSDVNYDCITVMVWEDKAAFDRFFQVFSTKEVAERVAEDNKNFLDSSLQLIYELDEPSVTKRA